jgi:HK97 family phage major capsid protein
MKHTHSFTIEKNAVKDKGDGVVEFPRGLTITDTSEQRNGTKYDIKSMDISEYDGNLTANHSDDIREIIGETFGVKKGQKKITIDGIRFAIKENALARFAYDMMLGGFLKNFSIETMGPWPDDEGTYKDSKLIGLSAVVLGNNRSASLQALAMNSLAECEQAGLDTLHMKQILLSHNLYNPSTMKLVTIKNTRDFPVKVAYNNVSEEETETTLQPGESVDVTEDQQEAVEAQVADAQSPVIEEDTEDTSEVVEAVNKLVAPMLNKMEKLEKQLFNKGAKEPAFRKDSNSKEMQSTDWRKRHGKQILHAWNWLRGHNDEAHRSLVEINKFHVEQLQKEGIVQNSMTIADFGNFVISPELLREIEGHRSNFSALLEKVPFRDTLSLQMSWLKRDGDVNMQEVELCDDGAGGNLKPISEYEAELKTSNLHELAAVTPVCNAATRFLAADMLGDIAQGYRTDYDRKRAQLFIARLQQAVNSTGNTTSFLTATDINSLKSIIRALRPVAETVMNGIWIMNHQSYWRLVEAITGAGIAGPLAPIFTTGQQPAFLGRPYVVVPDELLPVIDTGNTNRVFVVEGTSITVNQAIFYVDPSIFSGRTSGGLQYDLSTEAAYEVNGTVRSAYQRNELVLRGSFFRGGAVRDVDKVAGIGAPGVS